MNQKELQTAIKELWIVQEGNEFLCFYFKEEAQLYIETTPRPDVCKIHQSSLNRYSTLQIG